MVRRWFSLALVVLVVPTPALAEQRTAEERLADEAFQRGRRLFDAEDFLGAARQFEEAYRTVPVQAVHFNIARSYELADLPDLAAEHYQAFLDARAGNPERRQMVTERLGVLMDRIGWVQVTTEPAGAVVLVDGAERGTSPARLALTRGQHSLEARLGESVATSPIDVGPGETAITLSLEQRTSFEPEDGEEPPIEDTPPDHGGGRPQVPRGPEHHSVRRLHHAFFWAGLGLTLASGVALAVVGTRLLSTEEEYQSLPAGDEREDELIATGQQLESATTALWVTTGVLVVATVVFAIFTDWHRLRRGGDRAGQGGQRRWAVAVGQGTSLALSF